MPRPPDVLRYLKLPDKLASGFFDEYGHQVGAGGRPSVVLFSLPGDPPPWQCWGVFEKDLEPGQRGFLIFTNVPGQAVPGGAFTEWDRKSSTPFFTADRLMLLYSVQRSLGAARIIGRNDSGTRTAAAAGLLFVAPAAPAGAAGATASPAPAVAAPAAAGSPGNPAAAAPAAPGEPRSRRTPKRRAK